MGDTRCKHCGERIKQLGVDDRWYHRGPDDAPVSGAYRICHDAPVATPEEARRG